MKRDHCASTAVMRPRRRPRAHADDLQSSMQMYIDVNGKRPTACENIERDRTCDIPQPLL